MRRAVGLTTLLLLLGVLAGVTGTLRLGVAPAYAQSTAVIAQIIVRGNQRVEAETVRSYMTISVGETYDPAKVSSSVKALFRTGLFADVRIVRQQTALFVSVVENPIVNRINFEGNASIDDETLQKDIELRSRMVFTRARAQSDVQRIVTLYRRLGRFAARVEPKIIQLSQNRVDLVYEISEGPVTKIERINFVGNRAFSDSQLRGVISTSESAWWKILASTDSYDPDRLNFDKELLRRHYLKNGYADFRVLSAVAELSRDGESFFITVSVEEGKLYKFGPSKVVTSVAILNASKLEGVIVTEQGATYDTTKVDKTVENLALEAGKSGFAFAKIRPKIERDEATRTIAINYEISEGPRVYIERIDIVGNVRTLDKVIRREFRLVEGDAYNRILIDKARRRLVSLDFFEKVEIKESPGSAADKVVLSIVVVEKSTGQLTFGLGVSTSELLVGDVSIEERNLLGRGQFVRLRTGLSFKRQQVAFNFTEPYFLGRNISAGVDAFATETDLQDESSFDSRQAGGGFRFGFPIAEDTTLLTRYNFRFDDVRNVSATASPVIRAAAGSRLTSSVGYTVVYNTLDNPLNPTKGIRASVSQDFAGLGGSVNYISSEGKFAYYHPLFFEGVVGSIRASGGYIEGWGGREVPVFNRFYKGDSSFRGFERSGIGPRDTASANRDAIGGKIYGISTAEVTFPVGLPEEFGIRGAVFSDIGTLFDAPETGPGIRDEAALRVSAGAGVLWSSPFGPIRVDVAYPLVKKAYDREQLFRFSAGTQF